MEKIELIKILMRNTNINFLLGAGTSYNLVDGKIHFPLMYDLLKHISSDKNILDFYEILKNDDEIPDGMGIMLSKLYDTYLFAKEANIEKFLSVLEGVDLYIVDVAFRKEVVKQRNLIRTLIRKRLMQSDKETVLNTYIAFYNGLRS